MIIEGNFSSVLDKKNIRCEYLLDSPCQDTSNEYQQHTFL